MVPLASLAALICVGIGVDFSGQAIAEQDLRDQAAYCAREGAQGVALGAANTAQAVDFAYQCLSNQGLSGKVTLEGGLITVTLTGVYPTKLLTIISIDELPVRGTASSSVSQGR